MNIIEKQTVKHFHASRIKEFDLDRAKAQGWKDDEAQKIRFEVFTSLIDFNKATVLDIGCGYGDFRQYLEKSFLDFRYIGLDQQSAFINTAKEQYKADKHSSFYEMDFANCQLPKADIVTASGVLSYFSEDKGYYFAMIHKFYEAAEKYFIFNMLDDEEFESGPLLVAHNKDRVFEACQKISPESILHAGYLPDDFTIVMKK